MLRIILAGCNGRMGTEVSEHCRKQQEFQIAAGYSRHQMDENYPVYTALEQCSVTADVLVDFSRPEAIHQILPYCVRNRLPAVLGVTGYSQQQLNEIHSACELIPIFRAANFSIGANVLLKLVRTAAPLLGDEFDADIIERHHRNKLDSPSGTALLLWRTLGNLPEIKSIRSGSTAGEHTVLFAGADEVLVLSHRADSRNVYAAGAMQAARFIAGVDHPGLYGMEDLLQI